MLSLVNQITRHVWEDSREWVREDRLSAEGRLLYKKRQEMIERSYADAKQLHGFRYYRFRGQEKVQEQALLTAACQNMKKIATYLSRGPRMSLLLFFTVFIFLIIANGEFKL